MKIVLSAYLLGIAADVWARNLKSEIRYSLAKRRSRREIPVAADDLVNRHTGSNKSRRDVNGILSLNESLGSINSQVD
jgi:hypothetical protein